MIVGLLGFPCSALILSTAGNAVESDGEFVSSEVIMPRKFSLASIGFIVRVTSCDVIKRLIFSRTNIPQLVPSFCCADFYSGQTRRVVKSEEVGVLPSYRTQLCNEGSAL
jgi:hypothetical protein